MYFIDYILIIVDLESIYCLCVILQAIPHDLANFMQQRLLRCT